MQRLETAGDRVTAVVTDKGRIAADRVVVAMGSFTGLLRGIGVDVPIYPVKGLSITFPRGGWNGAPRMPVIDDSKLFGLVPIGDRLRISGSAEIAGFDTTPAVARCEAIVANASQTFPELPRAISIAERPGLGRAASRHARRHADHRADQDRQCLGQCRSRPSRLDARLRLGACAR